MVTANSGEETTKATNIFEVKGGKQAIQECNLPEEFCKGKTFSLEMNAGLGFETATFESTEEVAFEPHEGKGPEFDY
jgi:hypothetical protein